MSVKERVISMRKGIVPHRWLRRIAELASLGILLGLVCGLAVALAGARQYFSAGFLVLFSDVLGLSINRCIWIAFLFLALYSLILFAVRRLVKQTSRASLIAGSLAVAPFLLYWGLQANRAQKIYWAIFFEPESLAFNFKLGTGLFLAWLVVAFGMRVWSESELLRGSAAPLRRLLILLGLVGALKASMFIYHNRNPVDQPNIIVILIDALRADHVGAYGYHRATTPRIDEFSKDAVVFRQAISQSTFTKTSIASLFTSQNPHQHGIYRGNRTDPAGRTISDVLSSEERTLAEALLDHGYLTAAWIYNGHLTKQTGFGQGFVDFDEPAGGIRTIQGKFSEWLRLVGGRQKFFSYLHTLSLHDPYRPVPPYDSMFGIYSPEVYKGIDFQVWGHHRQEILEGRRELTPEDVEQLIAFYDGQLVYVDGKIGEIFDELKRVDLYDDSLIILTSDHGDGFMEHGFISHSNVPYEELIRVPLIVKFPQSQHRGVVVNEQVRLIDVMPSILDYLRIPPRVRMAGTSFTSLLSDREVRYPEYAYSEISIEGSYSIVSVRSAKSKYLYFDTKQDEFYDLVQDPLEQRDILGSDIEEESVFRDLAQKAAEAGSRTNVDTLPLDEEAIDHLKALGYIQ